MSIGERLKNVRGPMLQEELASKTGVHKNTVASYERGVSQPDAEYLNKVLDIFPDVNPSWLLTGEGKLRRGEPIQGTDANALFSTAAELGKEYVLVPRYEVAASAGGGTVIHSEQVVDHLVFKSAWVKNALGVSVKDLALISVKGDSMEPTLSNGDLILIDISANRIEDNAIYVLQHNGALLVKRIQRKMDGSIIIISDNQLYAPETLKDDLADQLNVVGRVVWSGRRM